MSWRRWWSKLTDVTFHSSLGAGGPGSPLLPFCPRNPTQRQPYDLAFTITHIPIKMHCLLISSLLSLVIRQNNREFRPSTLLILYTLMYKNCRFIGHR